MDEQGVIIVHQELEMGSKIFRSTRSNNQENRNTILLEQSPRDPSTDRKTMEKYVRTRPWDRKV